MAKKQAAAQPAPMPVTDPLPQLAICKWTLVLKYLKERYKCFLKFRYASFHACIRSLLVAFAIPVL
jgi:hypothetical protein